jgi:hypothetical protein
MIAIHLGFHLTPAVLQSCPTWLNNHCLNENTWHTCICCAWNQWNHGTSAKPWNECRKTVEVPRPEMLWVSWAPEQTVRINWINAIHSVIFKRFFAKVHCQIWGPVKNGRFYFGIFSTKHDTLVDGHEIIITSKHHWNRPRNKRRYRANIVKSLYYTKTFNMLNVWMYKPYFSVFWSSSTCTTLQHPQT